MTTEWHAFHGYLAGFLSAIDSAHTTALVGALCVVGVLAYLEGEESDE